MDIIPNLGFLKLEISGFMRLVLSTNCAVRHLLYPQCHICHQRNTQMLPVNHQGESSSKGWMQLTSYLWKKIGMLWKNYGKAMEFLFWGSVRTLWSRHVCLIIGVWLCHVNEIGSKVRGAAFLAFWGNVIWTIDLWSVSLPLHLAISVTYSAWVMMFFPLENKIRRKHCLKLCHPRVITWKLQKFNCCFFFFNW